MRSQGMMERGVLMGIALIASTLAHADAERFLQCGLRDVRYEIIPLGMLGEGGGGASAVNDRGEVVGSTSISDEVGRAFIWDCARGMQNLGAIADDHFASVAYDINNRSEVVGQSLNMDVSIAFIWDRDRGMRPLIDSNALAYDINDRSEVIMFGGIGGGLSYWSEATGPRQVAEVVGFDITGDPFINDLGTIGGLRPIYDGDGPRFFNWNARTGLRDLGLRPLDQPVTFMDGMNNRGDLVGTTFVTHGYVPFIVTRAGEMQLLDETRFAQGAQVGGINDRRQIVGAIDTDTTTTPFLWDPVNGLRNLHALGAGDDGVRLWQAADINNWGWIAGTVYRSETGRGEAALIVPVPKGKAHFRNLSKLSGAKLCRALDAVKLHAVVSCLLTGK